MTAMSLIYTFRNVNTNSYDIFYFELYEEARPQAVKNFKGEVTDQKGNCCERCDR